MPSSKILQYVYMSDAHHYLYIMQGGILILI